VHGFGFLDKALLLRRRPGRFDALTLDLSPLSNTVAMSSFSRRADFGVLNFEPVILFSTVHPHAFGDDLACCITCFECRRTCRPCDLLCFFLIRGNGGAFDSKVTAARFGLFGLERRFTRGTRSDRTAPLQTGPLRVDPKGRRLIGPYHASATAGGRRRRA